MRSLPRTREDGTVLLSTLLIMSIMSAVALALLATVQSAITRTSDLQARSQADLYAIAARDFAQSQLDRIAGLERAVLNAQLATQEPILLPFENGSVALSVADGTHCLRLSGLSLSDGTGSDTEQARFAALMEALGVDNVTASRVAAAAVDWVDRDSQSRPGGAEDGIYLSRQSGGTEGATGPHRTANVPFSDVSELRAVEGMDEPLFRTLRPHLCIGTAGAPTIFNINTAETRHAPVLAAILGGGQEAEQAARDLIESRPSGGYATLEAVPALDGYDNAAANLSAVVFSPQRLTVEVLLQYGPIQRAQLLAYEGLDSGRPNLSYRGFGRDAFPSVAWRQSGEEISQP